MLPRRSLPPVALAPLTPGDRWFIRDCAQKGDTVRQLTLWTGRPEAEIRAVLERQEDRR